MKAVDIPSKFPIPFANNADGSLIWSIPEASQIGITNGRASLYDGFVPLNFVPVAAGGVPPWGKDFNGLLEQSTAWSRFSNASPIVPFDSAFSTAIGGYPQGAIVQSVSTLGLVYFCTIDDNVTDPDAGGAGWVSFNFLLPPGIYINRVIFSTPGSFSFTVPPHITVVRSKVWGAGGGGGYGTAGSPSGAASGGGGGCNFEKTLIVSPGDVITGSVGSGGPAGFSGGATGTMGNPSIVTYASVSYTAGGGSGGIGAATGIATNSVLGGSATGVVDFERDGQPSYGGLLCGSSPSNAGGGGSCPNGGYGGQAGTGAGNPGGIPGGGGAGSASGQVAGPGARGEVWFEY